MASFELERKIPPSEVTLDLLTRLQKVLLEDVASRFSNGDSRRSRFSISIVDAFGEEAIGRIEEYRPAMLPDSTAAVSIRYSSHYDSTPSVTVRVAFSLQRHMSRFQVTAEGDAARDTALSIADLISRVLEPQRRAHSFFHPGIGLEALRFTLGFTALILALQLARQLPSGAYAMRSNCWALLGTLLRWSRPTAVHNLRHSAQPTARCDLALACIRRVDVYCLRDRSRVVSTAALGLLGITDLTIASCERRLSLGSRTRRYPAVADAGVRPRHSLPGNA